MKRLLAILLVMCMLPALCACGAEGSSAAGEAAPVETAVSEPEPETVTEPSPEPTPAPYDPSGAYTLTGITGGEGSDLEIVKRAVEMGMSFFLFLEEDGTGRMRFMEAEIPLNWDDETIIIPPLGKSTKTLYLPCSCEEGAVSIRTLAYTMDFRALTDEELADYEANGSGSLSGMAGAIVQGLIDSLGGNMVEDLLFSLALGSLGPSEVEAIPDGEFTAGNVIGTVHDLEITILGADHLKDPEAGDVIVLYFEAKNCTDELRALWYEDVDASQGGKFLESVYEVDMVPEIYNMDFEFIPGRTIRAAAAFMFDPEGGKISFRISSYYDKENALFYYADPQALSGAPAEPFVFDADPALPAMFKGLPEKTENVSFEGVEFFTYDEGRAMRFFLHLPNDSEAEDDDYLYHYCDLYQDGIELARIWDDPDTEGSVKEHLAAGAVRLRTESPVMIVVTEEDDSGTAIVAAKVFEVTDNS